MCQAPSGGSAAFVVSVLLCSAAFGGLFVDRRVRMHPHTMSKIMAAKNAPSCISCMASSDLQPRGCQGSGMGERAADRSAVQMRQGEKRDGADERSKRARFLPSQSSRRPRSRWPNRSKFGKGQVSRFGPDIKYRFKSQADRALNVVLRPDFAVRQTRRDVLKHLCG